MRFILVNSDASLSLYNCNRELFYLNPILYMSLENERRKSLARCFELHVRLTDNIQTDRGGGEE